MSTKFIIEDTEHAETISEHDSRASAEEELRRLASIPWDQPPNKAPCASWESCGRSYEIVEYRVSAEVWSEVRRLPGFEINRARD